MKKSTDGIENLIKQERRCGNTTRIVDNAIQLLFQGEKVKVIDHVNTPQSNRYALDILLKRLAFEHRIDKNILSIDIIKSEVFIRRNHINQY